MKKGASAYIMMKAHNSSGIMHMDEIQKKDFIDKTLKAESYDVYPLSMYTADGKKSYQCDALGILLNSGFELVNTNVPDEQRTVSVRDCINVEVKKI